MALQPTNAGIEYQQRVSAQWLLFTVFSENLDLWLDFSSGTVSTLRFETGLGIDDLVITNSTNEWYYMQIKRTISYSNKVNSDFYKVMEQFIDQYIINANKDEKYILVTSSGSSSKITDRLLKLLNGIRIADSISETMLVLNVKDRELLETLIGMVKEIFLKKKFSSMI